jgi:hypothetical protein
MGLKLNWDFGHVHLNLKIIFFQVIRADNTVIFTWCRFEDEIACICYTCRYQNL